MNSAIKINYSTVIIDLGSGLIKAGFGGEDGPRCIFKSIVGVPKKLGILVGMEEKERYVGNEAIERIDMMDFISPIQRGLVADWEKFETLLHYLFYNELKIVPEETDFLITECPLSPKENRRKIAELLFESYNVNKLYIANSSMLGLYSYGKSTGLILDSGYGVTSTVPIYEGYPLAHASQKLDLGGEDLSKSLLNLIQPNIDACYKGMRGLLLADKIKEEKGYIYLGQEADDAEVIEEKYILPDGKELELSTELYKHCDELFNNISNCVLDSIQSCEEIINPIKENICLCGGTSLLSNFNEKLKIDLSKKDEIFKDNAFRVECFEERQFSNWIGGSILSSLNTFPYMWVSKEEYDANKLDAIDSKCY